MNPIKKVALLVSIIVLFAPKMAYPIDVIVHNGNTNDALSLQQVRYIFLMRTQKWPNGANITVYVNQLSSDIHKKFTRNILEIIPHRINASWERRKYSGIGDVPEIVKNEQEIIKNVSNTQGAIGYVSNVPDEFKNKVKILNIKE